MGLARPDRPMMRAKELAGHEFDPARCFEGGRLEKLLFRRPMWLHVEILLYHRLERWYDG